MRTFRVAVLLTVAVVLTTSCGLFGGGGDKRAELAKSLNTSVAAVDGVESSELTVRAGSSGNEFVDGTVKLTGPTTTEGTTQLEAVLRAMVPSLKTDEGKKCQLVMDVVLPDGTAVSTKEVGLTASPFAYQVVEKYGS